MKIDTFSDILKKEGFFVQKAENLPLSLLKTRKKIEIYTQDDKILFITLMKSRILKKEFEIYETLARKVSALKGKKFTSKILLHSAPICSKSLAYANENNWKALNVSL